MLTRKKYISKYLAEMLSETGKDCSEPKNKLLARFLINLALNDKEPAKLRMEAVDMILDRVEGKAVNMNINADITENPFDGIDTAKLEALKAKLLESKSNLGGVQGSNP